MMRNRESKCLLMICLGVTGTLTLLGLTRGREFALFALLVCGACSAVAFVLLKTHLKHLEGLTAYVQRALRGDEPLRISHSREGEYGIFENELYKLSAALHHQLKESEEERKYLAEALADISHQIKTPLTAMGIECQLLRGEKMEEHERRRLARDLDQQLQRVEKLITMLLKMSRIDAGVVSFRREKHRADDLIDEALSPLLIPLELKEIQVLRRGRPEDQCACDGSWTREALGNILKNGMEHTPPGGLLTISHQETPLMTSIAIENNGPPIPEADLPHIFERFYRGQDTPEGNTGIGLAFARQVIVQQEGALKVENTPEGPRFTATFYKRTL